MKDFNSNCINSENAFSNAYNRQFGGEIFFLLSAFQEGCVLPRYLFMKCSQPMMPA